MKRKEYVRVSDISCPEESEVPDAWLISYGAVCLYLCRDGTKEDDRGEVQMLGIEDKDGNVHEQTVVSLPGQVPASCIPCRWGNEKILVLCSGDNSKTYDKVIDSFRDITGDFVRSWNSRFVTQTLSIKEVTTDE